MTTTDHPLTETAAAELWDNVPDSVYVHDFDAADRDIQDHTTAAMRAAFDAGREHERALADQTLPAGVTDEMVEAAARASWDADDAGLAWDDLGNLASSRLAHLYVTRIALSVGLSTPTDPHHDPRPWQDCTRDDIRKGDLVGVRIGDTLFVGVAHHQDQDGDWHTGDGWPLTNADRWPLRRIPAPVPPAEEVALPTGFGAVITDVEADLGETVRLDRMVWTGRRWTFWDYSTTAEFITAFTLPDGTRARRDGEHEDGEPRFVKEDDQ